MNRYVHYIDVGNMTSLEISKLILDLRKGILNLHLFFRGVTQEEVEKIK